VPSARIAFAGLSPLCEDILKAALRERSDVELIAPWTKLPSLSGAGVLGPAELLFVELDGRDLPPALRLLVVAAEPLRIVGLSSDARSATVFSLRERRTVMFDYSAARLWEVVGSSDDESFDSRSGSDAES